MGSSKKHKKESKKKKHRSRSRSPNSLGIEKERKHHHKKHKDRKRDRSPDVEEVPVDSHLHYDRNGDSTKDEEHSKQSQIREDTHRSNTDHKECEPSPPVASTSNAESLSIEETNRLRLKLGLKPLEAAKKPDDDGKIKDDLGEFYHKPAANLSEQRKGEKIREKLLERKEKRQMEKRIQTTLLADEPEDEDALLWIRKSRALEKQKEEAAKRAAVLDEMDEVFGVSTLVAEEEKAERNKRYTSKQLKGLRVAHDIDSIGEEHDVILTLADKNVLDEENEDVLVNVNIVDNEKYKKNIEERKKAKAGYQAYEDKEDIEAAILGLSKPVLSKYDEEIDKGKTAKERGFVIGDEDAVEAKRFRQMMIKQRLAIGGEKRLESLVLPQLKIASDYMDEHEVAAKFKKPKKRGKIRKKAKQEPIDVDEYDPNNAPLETDDTDVKIDELKKEQAIDEEEVEPDSELQVALARARRMRLIENQITKVPKVEEILENVKEESVDDAGSAGHMVLDATAEFCRTLGDIPTYGLAGNRDSQLEIMDYEQDIEPEGTEETGAWSRVDVNAEKPPDITASSSGALDAEPALGAGIAGALQLAVSKGYLERQTGSATQRASAHHNLLMAQHYSIEDKTYGEDDKYGRRERGYSGPLSDFREKNNFKPNIKLEYVDDEGRPLCPKEAFRYLSHKFHGKGPGKNKQEKRIKKAVQEGLMKKMSSTDTPLGTLAMLQDKQRETQSPYVVLSGAKRDQH